MSLKQLYSDITSNNNVNKTIDSLDDDSTIALFHCIPKADRLHFIQTYTAQIQSNSNTEDHPFIQNLQQKVQLTLDDLPDVIIGCLATFLSMKSLSKFAATNKSISQQISMDANLDLIKQIYIGKTLNVYNHYTLKTMISSWNDNDKTQLISFENGTKAYVTTASLFESFKLIFRRFSNIHLCNVKLTYKNLPGLMGCYRISLSGFDHTISSQLSPFKSLLKKSKRLRVLKLFPKKDDNDINQEMTLNLIATTNKNQTIKFLDVHHKKIPKNTQSIINIPSNFSDYCRNLTALKINDFTTDLPILTVLLQTDVEYLYIQAKFHIQVMDDIECSKAIQPDTDPAKLRQNIKISPKIKYLFVELLEFDDYDLLETDNFEANAEKITEGFMNSLSIANSNRLEIISFPTNRNFVMAQDFAINGLLDHIQPTQTIKVCLDEFIELAPRHSGKSNIITTRSDFNVAIMDEINGNEFETDYNWFLR